jgi:hypothetical protein
MHVAKPQEPKQEDQRKEETMTKKSFFDSLSWQQDQGQGQKQPVKSFADQESESCLLSGSEDEDDFATLTSERLKGLTNGNSGSQNSIGENKSSNIDLFSTGGQVEQSNVDLFSSNTNTENVDLFSSNTNTENVDLFSSNTNTENVDLFSSNVKTENQLFDLLDSGEQSSGSNEPDLFNVKNGGAITEQIDLLNINQPSSEIDFLGTQDNSSKQSTFDPFLDLSSPQTNNSTLPTVSITQKSQGTFDPFQTSVPQVDNSQDTQEDEFIKLMESKSSNDTGPNLMGEWNSTNVINFNTSNIPVNRSSSNLRQSHSASNLGGIPGNNGGSTLSTGQRPEGYGSQQNILSASKPAQQPQQSTKFDPFADLGKIHMFD